MKLLKEHLEEKLQSSISINESKDDPDFYLEGIFIQTNIKNRNGRIYPKDIVAPEVERYKKECIDTKRALGTLNHPVDGSPNIDLKEVSHLITDIWEDGDYYRCRAKILDTTNGRIVKAFIKEGIQLGVSTRAMGTVTHKNGTDYVNSDFHLITAGDIVYMPSSQAAYPVGLMEETEYVYDEKSDSFVPLAESKNCNEKNEQLIEPKNTDDEKNIEISDPKQPCCAETDNEKSKKDKLIADKAVLEFQIQEFSDFLKSL